MTLSVNGHTQSNNPGSQAFQTTSYYQMTRWRILVMPSIEHEEVAAMMSGGLGLEDLSIEEQRAFMEASADMFPLEEDVLVTEADADGVPVDWLTIEGSETNRVLVYLHGGAFSMGSRNTHRALAARIARAADAKVLLPEYRLAPEHPFPAAIEDVVTCWRWLLTEGYESKQIVLAGDSAGGGLALGATLSLKDAGEPLPVCVVGLSPWTDLEGQGPTAEPGLSDDPMMTPEGVRMSGELYAPNDRRHPFAAPLYGELEGFPPLLIQVGTREVLLSDSTRFAEKAEAAGVEVALEVEDGLIHVWHMFPNVPEAQSAVQRVGAFVKRHC